MAIGGLRRRAFQWRTSPRGLDPRAQHARQMVASLGDGLSVLAPCTTTHFTPALASRCSSVFSRLHSPDRRVPGFLPPGRALPVRVWEARHRGIVWLLWAHVPVLFVIGVMTHHPATHAFADVQPIILAAAAAS